MFDFAECFTQGAQRVVPQLAQQGLTFTFDMDVPTLLVDGDVSIVERSLHRMLLGACALLDTGLLAMHGSMDAAGRPSIRLTGAGSLASGERLTSALEALSLAPAEAASAAHVEAQGNCPVSGARVGLRHDAASGFVLEATLPFERVREPFAQQPCAHGAVVWVCLPTYPATGVLTGRLERLGWVVVMFELATAVEDATSRLLYEQPALLIAQFMTPSAEPESLRWLDIAAPPAVLRVLGVPLGHSALGATNLAVRMQAIPFSPLELARLTAAQEPEFHDDTLRQAATEQRVRPLLLVVDDNEVNQAIIGAMGDAMGYAVLHAANGQDAVDLCSSSAPTAVLMDVNMPVMDGIEATRQIRALQRSGAIAPFAILGASSDSSHENETACLAAGMDAFMTKPLMIADVSAHLRRLGVGMRT